MGKVSSSINQDRLNAALERAGMSTDPRFPPHCLIYGGDLAAREIIAAAEEADPEDAPRTVRKDAEKRIRALYDVAFDREARLVMEELPRREGVTGRVGVDPAGEKYVWIEAGTNRVYAVLEEWVPCFEVGWAVPATDEDMRDPIGLFTDTHGEVFKIKKARIEAGPAEGEFSDAILDEIPGVRTCASLRG